MNNLSRNKKIGIILGAVLLIVGLIVTIFLVQKSQENRGHAEKATTLSLTPSTQTVGLQEDAKLDLNINPGTNQVNSVKFTIKFDPTAFDPSLTILNVDPNSKLKITEGPTYTDDGTVSYTLATGSDPTSVVQTAGPIGTILLPVRKDATSGTFQVTFDEANTQVRSIASTDSSNENVLSSTTPASVTVAAECKPNIATCSWDALEGATKYHFTVKDQTGAQIVDGETAETSKEFPATPGNTYTCDVKALNDCGGVGEAGEGVSSCATPSGTPTPTPPTSSPSPTPSVTVTPTPTSGLTPTPTQPGVTSTPTPTNTWENIFPFIFLTGC